MRKLSSTVVVIVLLTISAFPAFAGTGRTSRPSVAKALLLWLQGKSSVLSPAISGQSRISPPLPAPAPGPAPTNTESDRTTP